MDYKTPGVYVVEKSVFPPSVAQVETAIPAFLGYTEFAIDSDGSSLANVPKRISSLLEYQEFFGFGPPVTVSLVDLGADLKVKKVTTSQIFYMYDSLRMFFANGGGDCYIVSVGTYFKGDGSPKAAADLNKNDFINGGLPELYKKDEPTLILFPDGVSLPNTNDIYDVQVAALTQCGELMDRFGVFDIKYSGSDKTAFNNSVTEFRNNVGLNNLKYGSVYAPWVKVSIPRNLTYADVKNATQRFGGALPLINLVTPADTPDKVVVNTILTDYNTILSDKAKIIAAITALKGVNASLKIKYDGLVNALKAEVNVADPAANIANVRTKFAPVVDEPYNVLKLIDDLLDIAPAANQVLYQQLRNEITVALTAISTAQTFIDLNTIDTTIAADNNLISSAAVAGYARHKQAAFTANPANFNDWDVVLRPALIASANTPAIFKNPAPAAGAAGNLARVENMSNAEVKISAAYNAIHSALDSILNSVTAAINAKENGLQNAWPLYKSLITAVNNSLTLLPPSGAMVGLYAQTDRTRGVWKAPANVTVNMATGVSYEIDDNQQQNLNVDVNYGKSVNVIRPFTGAGITVWGARTLAGNDNEWRYIPVRRFFNMVEESVKKSTRWAVFEPNDANTWVKVKGMIENFLVLQWRNGALQGAKPNDAFFVKVGLGETMSYQDVLEGRMNVEIGMAVVRPAEFIILTFTHKIVTV